MSDIIVAVIALGYVFYRGRTNPIPLRHLALLIPMLPIACLALWQLIGGTILSLRTLGWLTLATYIYYLSLAIAICYLNSDAFYFFCFLGSGGFVAISQVRFFFRMHRAQAQNPTRPTTETLALIETLQKQTTDLAKHSGHPALVQFVTYSTWGGATTYIARLFPNLVFLTTKAEGRPQLLTPEEFQIEPAKHRRIFRIKFNESKVRIRIGPRTTYGVIKDYYFLHYENWNRNPEAIPIIPP